MDTQDAQERLMREFKLTEARAKFCILVASGMDEMEAVKECYTFKHDKNYYGQLRELVRNDKIDAAMKSLGMNLRDTFDKQAYAVVKAFHKIAFDEKTPTRDRLSALKELAAYNPMLQKMKNEDADDREESDTTERIKEWLDET